MKSIHDLDIIHRDLKSANIFVGHNSQFKIGDMNVSKVVNKNIMNYTQTGTPSFASPEVWRDEAYTTSSDIWSLGCVLYEVLTLSVPFQAENMDLLY